MDYEIGRKVECVFDPFDLTAIEVRYQNRTMGAGVPHRIGRHTHPMAKPEPPSTPPATGIDYLALLADRHATELADHTPKIGYAELLELIESTDSDQCPGQLPIPTTSTIESDPR